MKHLVECEQSIALQTVELSSSHHSDTGQHSGAVVSTVASQQEGPGFEGLSVWSLHVLPVSAWVLTGFSGFL